MMFSVRRVRTSAVTYNRVTSSFLSEFLQRELPGALGQHGDAQGDREAQQPAGVVHGNRTNKFLPRIRAKTIQTLLLIQRCRRLSAPRRKVLTNASNCSSSLKGVWLSYGWGAEWWGFAEPSRRFRAVTQELPAGCLCPGPEQQRPDEAAALPGVSDHPSGQHGAERGQEAHGGAAETVRRGR